MEELQVDMRWEKVIVESAPATVSHFATGFTHSNTRLYICTTIPGHPYVVKEVPKIFNGLLPRSIA